MTDELRNAVRDVLPSVRHDLDALIRIPSVSADPAVASELRRCAELTATLLQQAGAADVEIIDDVPGCKPAVVAHYPAPEGMPTVLLYAHHDVQPPGDPAGWSTPPFEPVERDGRLYARGSADDKAGIAAHLAALRAFGGTPPVGVTVFVEGEEEIGSPRLGELLAKHRHKLVSDVIVLADADNIEIGTPSITTSLRGVAACIVEVRTLRHGVHSGAYGGAAPDALTALCRLLATLHDDAGEVVVEGLVSAPSPAFDYPEQRFREEAAMLDGVALLGTGSIADRIWAKPSASVLALDATPMADVSNTLIPAARAKVSLRLAPGDDSVRARLALAKHLREHAQWGVDVTVTDSDIGDPYAIDSSGPAFDAARAAYRNAYGRELVEIGTGGTIPFVAQFAEAFPDAAILVVSAGADPDCRAHGTDESLHLGEFERACVGNTLLLAELARRGPATKSA
ncbi:MAG TPA: dipeptidase [Jatrophihabitantaceae bacterium]|jgi:acetylornithine deacetylase/succinyl-diaminopimelate desuccinylase-like protein|nr:dipeptidase [Jatrophihabitantaceae bacterium]